MKVVRLLALVPLLVYAVLTPIGVAWDYFHGTLGWHPDALLPFEIVGLTLCALVASQRVNITRKDRRGPEDA